MELKEEEMNIKNLLHVFRPMKTNGHLPGMKVSDFETFYKPTIYRKSLWLYFSIVWTYTPVYMAYLPLWHI